MKKIFLISLIFCSLFASAQVQYGGLLRGTYNSTAPTLSNGNNSSLQLDPAGNLKNFSGISTASGTVWNSGTTVNTTQNVFTNSGASAVIVHLVQSSGSFSAGAITYEISYDGTNWITIPANLVIDPSSTNYPQISVPYTLVTSTNKAFLIELNGAQGLRLKLSTAITGTGTVTPNFVFLNYQPIASVIAMNPTASNFNATVTATNLSSNIAQINGVTPLMGNGATGTGSPRVTIANDNTPFAVKTDQTTHGTTDLIAADITKINGNAVSTAASGVQKVGVVGNAGSTVDAAVGAGTAPTNMIVGGLIYNSTEISPTTGQSFALQGDSKGRMRMVLGDGAGNSRFANVDASNRLTIDNTSWLGSTAPTVGSKTSANSIPVVIASDQAAVSVTASNLQVNVNQIAGSAISTAATGVQKVGIVGNAGATLDAVVGAGTAPTNMIVEGGIYNTSALAPTNGQSLAAQFDQVGNTRVFPGIATASLSVWNSGTSINTTQNIFTYSGTNSVIVHLVQNNGTFTAGAINFEITYDGTNWITIPANMVLDPTSTTYAQISTPYTLVTSTNKAFLIDMNGAQGLRLKLSTAITGTGTVTPNYILSAYKPAASVIAYSPVGTNFRAIVDPNTQANWGLLPEDNPETAGAYLMGMGAVRRDAPASSSGTSGDNSTINVGNLGALWTAPTAQAGGGCDFATGTIGATKTDIGTANTPTSVYGFYFTNPNTSMVYVQVFNTQASGVTLGSTSPVLSFGVPGATNGAGGTLFCTIPAKFSTACSIAITTTRSGSTGPSSTVDYNIFYKQGFELWVVLIVIVFAMMATKVEEKIKARA